MKAGSTKNAPMYVPGQSVTAYGKYNAVILSHVADENSEQHFYDVQTENNGRKIIGENSLKLHEGMHTKATAQHYAHEIATEMYKKMIKWYNDHALGMQAGATAYCVAFDAFMESNSDATLAYRHAEQQAQVAVLSVLAVLAV